MGPQAFPDLLHDMRHGAGLIQEGVTAIRYLTLESGMSPEAVQAVIEQGSKALQSNMNFVDPAMASLNLVLNSSTVGASGAVYAILLGFGMLFPNQQMFIFPLPVPIKAKYFVMGYALIELYSGLANSAGDNVAHFAHLGGMIFGFFLIMYWRKKNRGNGYYYN